MKQKNEIFDYYYHRGFNEGYVDCTKKFQKRIDEIRQKLIENLCEKIYPSIPTNYATCDFII